MQAEQLFVTGYSRSGTTMMGRILGRNSAVFTFHEIHFFEQLYFPGKEVVDFKMDDAVALLCKLLSIERQGYLQERNPTLFIDEASAALSAAQINLHPVDVFRFFLSYESKKNGKQISCDQTPRNALFMEEILNLYPRAYIVAMIRDPRDVLLSQKGKWKRRFLGAKTIPLKESIRSWINYHPVTITKLWCASTRSILKFKNHERVIIIKFEDLLAQPEQTVQAICKFAGIDFASDMLNVPKVGSSLGNDKPDAKGINSDNRGNYLQGLSKSEIVICERSSTSLRQLLNYPDSKISANPVIIAFQYLIMPIKLAVALLVNLGRTKNLLATIKRRLS